MLPFILAAVGGYLIGDSMKSQSFADGGDIESAARMKADNPKWTNEELLAEYQSLSIDLEDLKEGKITPRKIIGGGYKSSAVAKRIAKQWLENRIAEYKMALEMRGVMADGGMMTDGYKIKYGDVAFKPYGKTKGKYSITYKADGKLQKEIWDTKEMALNAAKRYNKIEEFSEIKVYDESGKRIMADGGQFDYGFTIRQMNETLMSKFPDSFGFNVYPVDTKELNMGVLKIFPTVSFYGLTDSEINSKLFFPQYKRDHEINYHIRQGSENTYFDFLLEDENGKYYVGTFGFKDQGMVPASYITEFIAFLQEAYGLPFTIEHTVK